MSTEINYDTSLRFGDGKIKVSPSNRTDKALFINMINGNTPDFTSEDSYKLMLRGIPLQLSYFNNSVTINNNSTRLYALEVIEESSINPIDNDMSFVWEGIRFSAQQNTDNKIYWEILKNSGTGTPINKATIHGMPLATTATDELIIVDSGYTTSDIDEYLTVSIGGIPLTVGRIGNEYYLVIYPTT